MMTDGLPASTAMLLHRYFGGPPCQFSSCTCHSSAGLQQGCFDALHAEYLQGFGHSEFERL